MVRSSRKPLPHESVRPVTDRHAGGRRKPLRGAVLVVSGALVLIGLSVPQASAFPGTDTITWKGIDLPAGRIASTHEKITKDAVTTAASDLFQASTSNAAAQSAIRRIVAANAAVDDDQTHAALHFDGESFPEGQARLLALRSAVISALQKGAVTQAQDDLGSLLHTLQDFYSHSNWVELGNTVPHPDLGRPGHSLGRLGADVRTCSGTGSSDLVTNQLTSGYFPGEDRVFVTGKCHHGGILDSSLPGINKDTRLFLLSPHGNYHQKAAELATTASVTFLEELAGSVTPAQMRALLGLGT